MKINLNYQADVFPYSWVLETSNGLGLTVEYVTKPTQKQIRKQIQAIHNADYADWDKTYNVKKGKML